MSYLEWLGAVAALIAVVVVAFCAAIVVASRLADRLREPVRVTRSDRRCGGAACPVLQSPPAPPYGPNPPWSRWEQDFEDGSSLRGAE